MAAPATQPDAGLPPKPSWGRRAARLLASLGRSVYLATIQGIVGLVWLATVVYLAVNSPSAARIGSEVASQVLPGELRMRSLRVGPVVEQGELRVRLVADQLEVREPLGEVVLSARLLVVELAPSRLVDGLRAGALRLSLPRLDLQSPLVVLDNDAKGRLRLVTAFVDFDQPPDPAAKPMPVWLRLGAAKVRDAAFRMDLPAMQIDSHALDFDSNGAQIEVPVGRPPQVQYSLQRAVAGHVAVTLDAMRLLPPIPAGSLQLDSVEGDLQRVLVDGLSVQMPPVDWRKPLAEPDAVISRARIDVEMASDIRIHADQFALATSSKSPFLRDLLGDLFDARAAVVGQFRFDLLDGFWAQGDVAASGLISGFQTEALRGKVEVETGSRGDAAMRVISTDLQLHAYGGWLTSPRIEYKMALDRPEHQVRGEFFVDGMRGDLPLMARSVGLVGLTPALAAGWLKGRLGTAVRIHLPTGRPLDMDVALDADLSLDRDTFLDFIQQPLPRVEWRGGMRLAMGPDAKGQQTLMVTLDRSRLRAKDAQGGGELLLDLQADGALDLTGPATALALSLWMPRMQAWLEPLGLPGYQGSLRLEAGQLRGKMLAWDAQAALTVAELVTPWLKVRRASAKMSLQSGVLGLGGLRVSTDFGEARGDFTMALFGGDWTVLRPGRPPGRRPGSPGRR